MSSVYKRGKIWWIRFQFKGQEYRESSHSEARRDAVAFGKRRREEVKKQHRDGHSPTFDDMMMRFIDEHLSVIKPSSALRYTVSIASLKSHFTGMRLSDIGRVAIAEFVSARRKPVQVRGKMKTAKTSTVRRDLACLSSAFTCAVGWGMVERNPLKDFSRKSLPEGKARTRVLSEIERARVLAKATVGAAVVKAGWLTGMRLGELCALRRSDVDLDRGEIMVRDTKNSRPRIVPLDEEGLAHFQAQKFSSNVPWMFWWGAGNRYTVRQVSRAFNVAAKRAKVENARFHDTRHSFASDRISRGMDLYTLGRILGHSTPGQTAKYAHLQTQAMKDAMLRTGRSMGTKTDTEITEFSLEAPGKSE
jgi:integrase